MRIAGILDNDVVDGEGISVSLWVQGCPHCCEGCHNVHTWDPNGGTDIPLDELIDTICKKIEANGVQRNFSVLGGEPLSPAHFDNVLTIIREVKFRFPKIKVFIWTGYTYEELISREDKHKVGDLFCLIDMLVEGRFELDKRDISLPYRGSSNQRIFMHPHTCYHTGYLVDVTDKFV